MDSDLSFLGLRQRNEEAGITSDTGALGFRCTVFHVILAFPDGIAIQLSKDGAQDDRSLSMRGTLQTP